jgi:GMP synthase-like glutamine amidotransferase
VCFGHQIVGRAMGVKVGRNDAGWETAVNDVQLTEKGKEVFGMEKLVCTNPTAKVAPLTPPQRLHQMHRDMVFYYPQGVEELGYSPVCKVQGMYAPKRLFTVQGHPEFDEEIVTEILKSRHAAGIFNDEDFEAGMERVVKPHDGLVVSQAFLKFLLEE